MTDPHNHDQATLLALDLQKLRFEIEHLQQSVAAVNAGLVAVQTKVEVIRVAADRWKGGVLVIIALGGIITWLANIGPNLGKLFGK